MSQRGAEEELERSRRGAREEPIGELEKSRRGAMKKTGNESAKEKQTTVEGRF